MKESEYPASWDRDGMGGSSISRAMWTRLKDSDPQKEQKAIDGSLG
jgi:hypothetical protein